MADAANKDHQVEIQLEHAGKEQDPTDAGGSLAQDEGYDQINHILPKGYFRSAYFVGTLAAVAFSSAAAVGGFALIAPILAQVNADIGPNKNIAWVALVYTTCLTVGLTLVGRLSDIFGRRWFFITGMALGLIGCIICATAQSAPTLIGGEVLVGLASAAGVSYPFVLGELVPMKWRFAGNSFGFLFQLPTSAFGPAIAYSFLDTSAGWRWCYYYLIIWYGCALMFWFFFYHPPTFHMKHGSQGRKIDFVQHFDFKGTVLFVAGTVLFLMGLSWGGVVYPWRSAHVIATIVVGVACLIAFALCQVYWPGPEPLVPVHLFKDFGWVASTVVLGICGGVFYAFAIIWPSMFVVLYSKPNDLMYTGYFACMVGLGITVGQVFGGMAAKPLGHIKWQTLVSFIFGAIFLSTTAACNENTKAAAVSVLLIGCICIGWADTMVTSITTIQIKDQADIGIAAGIVGAVRTFVGAVPAGLIAAGLPASSVPLFLQAAAAGADADFSTIPGITSAIIKTGVLTYKRASLDAYRTVFFSSMAFMGLGVILCFFVPNIDSRMTGEISATLHRIGEEKPTVGDTKTVQEGILIPSRPVSGAA